MYTDRNEELESIFDNLSREMEHLNDLLSGGKLTLADTCYCSMKLRNVKSRVNMLKNLSDGRFGKLTKED